MMKKESVTEKKVLVAMSGGVDSSVAALLLKQAGYVVTGLTLRLWKATDHQKGEFSTIDPAIDRAEEVCRILSIDHLVVDRKEQFFTQVIKPFLEEYQNGKTPNPCWHCNRCIKWSTLLEIANQMKIDYVATGHYARIVGQGGNMQLRTGLDENKDQSYYLSDLTASELSKTLLPLGELTKTQVREIARQNHLPNAETDDSQDLCFLVNADYRKFIRSQITEPIPIGEIVDDRGKVLGKHFGLIDYTIGQRKGIRIAAGEPLFVIGKDIQRNLLIVGPASDLGKTAFKITNINQLMKLERKHYEIMIHYRAKKKAGQVTVKENHCDIILDQPARDITPGQIAVIYDNDLVVLSGVISDV